MKVFLGGTVNGSSWRNYVIPKLSIGYFNPVIPDWNEQAYQRELYERRHCNFCLYVITPKMTGFYALAEVVDDSFKRPDRTIYCYLREDGGDTFDEKDLMLLEAIGQTVSNNGAYNCTSLEQVIELLNNERPKSRFLEEQYQAQQHDVYISYGRHDSAELAKTTSNHLKRHGLSVWYDDAPIPQEIEFLEQINQLIAKAHSFVFILSPHSLKSEYCLRELEYVSSLGKHVIFLCNDNSLLQSAKFKDIRAHKVIDLNSDKPQQQLTCHLKSHIEPLKEHTCWSNFAQHWAKNQRDDQYLLYGRKRTHSQRWFDHKAKRHHDQLYHISNNLRDFIERSKSQRFAQRSMYQLNKLVSPLIYHQSFDKVIGSTAIANPLALLPQLWVLLLAANSDAISVFMWMIFLMLQSSSALFAIKHRNFGVCVSQFASMLITCAIIMLTLLKR